MTFKSHITQLRSVVPQPVRERAYAWHPGRARRWSRYPGLQNLAPGGHAVLTFDDGPDPEATPALLDALQRAGAHATFFLLGCHVAAHPEVAREVVRQGHEVGLHGYDHHRHDRIDAKTSRDDISRGFATLENTLGVRSRWYRPPYGKASPASYAACAELGMTHVYWSAWGLDWENVPGSRVAAVVTEELVDGSIVLLHDSARFARRASAMPTVEAIPQIAASARERQLSLVALREALPGEALPRDGADVPSPRPGQLASQPPR